MPVHPSTPKDPIYEFVLRIKLIFILLREKSISPLLKILPFIGLVDLFLPFKMFFPLDFLLITFLGGYLFLEFSPEQIRAKKLAELRNTIPGEVKKIPPKKQDSTEPSHPEGESTPINPKP